MTCDEVRCILKVMMHNIAEARDKIHKANEWKERNRGIADWHRQMAAAHLDFNSGAAQMARDGLREMSAAHGHDHDEHEYHHIRGKCEAYEEWLEHIAPETAEVRAMIDAYGK